MLAVSCLEASPRELVAGRTPGNPTPDERTAPMLQTFYMNSGENPLAQFPNERLVPSLDLNACSGFAPCPAITYHDGLLVRSPGQTPSANYA